MRRIETIEQRVRTVWSEELAAAREFLDRLVTLFAWPRRRNTVRGARKPHVFDLQAKPARGARASSRKRRRGARGHAGARPRA